MQHRWREPSDGFRVSHRQVRERAERLAQTPDALSSGKKGSPVAAAAATTAAVVVGPVVPWRWFFEHTCSVGRLRSINDVRVPPAAGQAITRRSSRTAARSSARARAKTIALHASVRDSRPRTVGRRCCGSWSRDEISSPVDVLQPINFFTYFFFLFYQTQRHPLPPISSEPLPH